MTNPAPSLAAYRNLLRAAAQGERDGGRVLLLRAWEGENRGRFDER